MPSPIIHAATGYAVYHQHQRRRTDVQKRSERLLLLVVVTAALIPDADFIPGLTHGQFSHLHNQGTHSIFTGVGFSLLVGLWGRLMGTEFQRWMLLTLAAFESHVVLDFFSGSKRGMMLLWPFSRKRFKFPLKLFYGVRWDRSPASWSHLWTIVTELAFLVIGALIVRKLQKRNG